MAIKISTGKYRGKTLASTQEARELRPTQSLVREAIISILQSYFDDFEEMNVLDLYAGIGGVGFELLSNEAQSITFVEKDPKCIKMLRTNLAKLKPKAKVTILAGVIPAALKDIKRKNSITNYDLIFADPPYKMSDKDFILTTKTIIELKLLRSGSILIWESDKKNLTEAFDQEGFNEIELVKTKKYGSTVLYFFQKK